MRGKYFLFFLVLFIFSCDNLVDSNFSTPPAKLVVISFFSPDSVFSVRISRVTGLNEFKNSYDTIVWIDDAICSLYVDDRFFEVLQDTGAGVYISPSGYKPEVGRHYKIKVYHENYPPVHAESYVPVSMPIISVLKKDSALIEGDAMGSYPLSFVSTIVDNELDSIQYLEFYLTQYWFYYSDSDVVGGSALLTPLYLGPALSEGFGDNSILFSSVNLQPGFNKLLCYYIPIRNYSNGEIEYYKNLQVHLRVISPEYYFYKLTSSMDDNFDPFFGGNYQPVSIYSNVKGGYGIFAGYNETVDSVSYPVSLDLDISAN